ncbi:MAG: diaminopimelate epimerase [Acidimicrobiales bacterium]
MFLNKHHGLGNDFLVTIVDSLPADAADLARKLCHRRLGIGADGLLFALVESNDSTTMVLFNSDGSRPEMSGNGIRCLAHAVTMRDETSEADILISTDGGPRQVQVMPGASPDQIMARVDMGPVGVGPGVHDGLKFDKAATADVGNPHLVIAVPKPADVDLAVAGPALEAGYPEGINVEFIAPTVGESDAIDLAVWERGAGITQACGTGACAAATRAHEWGLVGERVTVHMPGGDAVVEVGNPVRLLGPSVFVATVEYAHG